MTRLRAIDSSNTSSEGEEIVFENGTSCVRLPNGGRKGTFPSSGIEFELRARTLGDAQKLEKIMGGQLEAQKYTTEAVARMFCQICVRFGDENGCSTSQIYDLDEGIDGLYLANVISSFRTPA